MKCPNCYSELKETDQYCGNCGIKVNVKNTTGYQQDFVEETKSIQTNNYQQKSTEDDENIPKVKQDYFENPEHLTAIAAILFFVVPVISAAFAQTKFLSGIATGIFAGSPLAAIVLLIYTRIKFPEHRGSKILFIVVIILTILSVLVVGLLFAIFFKLLLELAN